MKKGKLAWEYIAAIILVLVTIIIIMLFTDFIKDLILDKWSAFKDYIKEAVGL